MAGTLKFLRKIVSTIVRIEIAQQHVLNAVDLRQTCHTGQTAGNAKGKDIDAICTDAAQLGGFVSLIAGGVGEGKSGENKFIVC